MVERVSGILLAGGKSERMGQDKRFVEYESRSLLDITLDRLKSVSDEVILVTAEPEDLGVENVISVSDISRGKGPLMGIYSGLSNMTSQRGIVNPVDTPNITEELLNHMIKISRGFDVLMPRRGNKLEPLIAVYSRKVLPVIDRFIKDGLKPAPHLLAANGNGLKVRILEERELLKFGEPEMLFQNINSPEDLRKHKSQLE